MDRESLGTPVLTHQKNVCLNVWHSFYSIHNTINATLQFKQHYKVSEVI